MIVSARLDPVEIMSIRHLCQLFDASEVSFRFDRKPLIAGRSNLKGSDTFQSTPCHDETRFLHMHVLRNEPGEINRVGNGDSNCLANQAWCTTVGFQGV